MAFCTSTRGRASHDESSVSLVYFLPPCSVLRPVFPKQPSPISWEGSCCTHNAPGTAAGMLVCQIPPVSTKSFLDLPLQSLILKPPAAPSAPGCAYAAWAGTMAEAVPIPSSCPHPKQRMVPGVQPTGISAGTNRLPTRSPAELKDRAGVCWWPASPGLAWCTDALVSSMNPCLFLTKARQATARAYYTNASNLVSTKPNC